jgi:hypothetical protein
MAAIYSNGGNRWNILGFNFTKRDALSTVYKISMGSTVFVKDIDTVCVLYSRFTTVVLYNLGLFQCR